MTTQMKISVILALVVGIVMAAGVCQQCSAQTINLLSNPGFASGTPEAVVPNGTNGAFTGWSYSVIGGTGNTILFRESLYSELGITPPSEYKDAVDAVRVRKESGDYSESIIYQDVAATPGVHHDASVWVRARDNAGVGFGYNSSDIAELWVQELNADLSVLVSEHKASTAVAGPYTNLSVGFDAAAGTAYVRFILHTKLNCLYSDGDVTYDNCALMAPPLPASLSGTVMSDGTPIEGATVTAQDISAISGPDGQYTLSGLTALRSVVRVSMPSYYSKSRYVLLQSGNNTLDFDITPEVIFNDNLLKNSSFEQGVPQLIGGGGLTTTLQSWTYLLPGETCIVYNESFYALLGLPVDYHQGTEAVRTRKTDFTGNAGDAIAYQDVPVMPDSYYNAMVWIRARNDMGNGFGKAVGTDAAKIEVEEYDSAGMPVSGGVHVSSLNAANAEYEPLLLKFTTSANTATVRLKLHTAIVCLYADGDVTYDDCWLDGPRIPAVLTGTVTSGGSALPNATVTAGSKSATTDSNGVYTITGLGAGMAMDARASKDGYYAQTVPITLNAGTNTVDFDLKAIGSNLLNNAGFEDNMVDWRTLSSRNSGVKDEAEWSSNSTHHGYHALSLYRKVSPALLESRVGQRVDVMPNSIYTATAWTRAAGSGTNWGTAPQQASVVIQEEDDFGVVTEYPVYVSDYSGSWQQLSTTIITGPNTRTVRFICSALVVDESTTESRVIFDDLELIGPAGTPPATLLFGHVGSGSTSLQGASVQTLATNPPNPAPVVMTTSQSSGDWALDVPSEPVDWWIRASKAGYRAQTLTRTAPDVVNFNLASLDNNLLVNPGFEDLMNAGNRIVMTGWTAPPGNTAQYRMEWNARVYGPAHYHSGEGAAQIGADTGNGEGRFYQDVPVIGSNSYTAAVWFYPTQQPGLTPVWGTNPNQKAALFVQEYDSNGNLLVDHPMVYATVNPSDVDNWQRLTLQFTTNSTTSYIRVGGYAYLVEPYAQTLGRAVFDGLELVGQAYQPVNVSNLKSNPGAQGYVTDKVVTASFNGFYYIEDQDRSSGVKVAGSAMPGQVVDVLGTVSVIDGEPTLVPTTMRLAGGYGEIPGALGMNNKAALELSPVGLYVTLWGRVDATGGSPFAMTDGSGAAIKVYGSAAANDYVMVTGALGSELSGEEVVPVIRAVSVMKVN